MTTTKATKTQITSLSFRIETLRAERDSEYTRRLGAAAVKCVQETLDAVEAELARVRAA